MIYDVNFNIIDESEIDLSIGFITTGYKLKEDATPIDNVTKFFRPLEDYDEVQMYIVDEHRKARKEAETIPSQLDIIEAQVAYTAMMTDTLLEG